MIDVLVYTINNNDYYLLEEISIDDVHYLYLSNIKDEGDFMLRKRDLVDPEVLHTLDNENEVRMASLVFANKMLDDK